MSANEHDDDQPDSFEVIERLRARVAQLEAALKDCADELEEHVEARYAKTKPHLERQYERDIEPVRQARAALGDTPQ